MQNLTLSITQLNNYIKNIFDNEELLIGVSVYGEVTNFKISNNIAYFDIKEDGAQLSCVKFSCYAPFAKNGDKVLVTGKLNYHIKLGKLSFVAQKVEPYGMGELYKKYLELKARLESEGLFDVSQKQPIPKFANKIGVVTSETGAVIRDIYHVTRAKNPVVDILVYPAKVQGLNAEYEIVAGIEYFNKFSDVDVIIVARGGGSFEDLSPFNTEIVARAAFNSRLPIISAIGHETDFSILDFSSDLRAPTPSVAGEIAVYNYYEEIQFLDGLQNNLKNKLASFVENKKRDVVYNIQNITKSVNQVLSLNYKDISNMKDNIASKLKQYLDVKKNNLMHLTEKLEKANPLSILKSGYAKVFANDKIVSKLDDVKVGDNIQTFVVDGIITSKVTDIKENRLWIMKKRLKN